MTSFIEKIKKLHYRPVNCKFLLIVVLDFHKTNAPDVLGLEMSCYLNKKEFYFEKSCLVEKNYDNLRKRRSTIMTIVYLLVQGAQNIPAIYSCMNVLFHTLVKT